MIVSESKLAKKYATAFLNVCKKEGHTVHTEILSTFANFVTSNKVFQATLSLPSLSYDKKTEIIELVTKKLQLSSSLKKLIFLLLKDKRIDLLGIVLRKILLLHRQQQQKHHFHVSTSHKISDSEKEAILNFIKTLVSNKVTASFDVDITLLSGIKIKGNTFLWERSIAKQLRKIEQKILRREELW